MNRREFVATGLAAASGLAAARAEPSVLGPNPGLITASDPIEIAKQIEARLNCRTLIVWRVRVNGEKEIMYTVTEGDVVVSRSRAASELPAAYRLFLGLNIWNSPPIPRRWVLQTGSTVDAFVVEERKNREKDRRVCLMVAQCLPGWNVSSPSEATICTHPPSPTAEEIVDAASRVKAISGVRWVDLHSLPRGSHIVTGKSLGHHIFQVGETPVTSDDARHLGHAFTMIKIHSSGGVTDSVVSCLPGWRVMPTSPEGFVIKAWPLAVEHRHTFRKAYLPPSMPKIDGDLDPPPGEDRTCGLARICYRRH